MSNPKLVRCVPNQPKDLPYVIGTEPGHFYLVLGETSKSVYGFRPLNKDFPTVGEKPQNGVSTRVRVVPKDPADYVKYEQALSLLGFDKRDYDGGRNIHFSLVTSEPATVVRNLEKLLAFGE